MSAETPNPQPGDTARFTYVATVHDMGDSPKFVKWAKQGDTLFAVPADATIEVLERADDPSQSLRGEIREIDGMAAVCYGKDMWVYFSALRHGATGGYGVYKDAQMIGAPVIGVVPHSPAAEEFVPDWERELIEQESSARRSVRVPNEPHGPSVDARRKAADLINQGKPALAVGVINYDTHWPWDEAERYVKSMSEYQTYLAAHGEKREPREFAADGPEPPAEVTVLVDRGDPSRMPYLLRSGDGWVWSSYADRIATDDTTPRPWSHRAVTAAHPFLLEVV